MTRALSSYVSFHPLKNVTMKIYVLDHNYAVLVNNTRNANRFNFCKKTNRDKL